jgi:hypothetical protein
MKLCVLGDFQETETLRPKTIKRSKLCAHNQENGTLRIQAVRTLKLYAFRELG